MDGVARRAFAGLDQGQDLPESARRVAAVDLLDDHRVLAGAVPGTIGQPDQGAVDELQTGRPGVVGGGAVAADEVLIRGVRMELDDLDFGGGPPAGENPAQALREPRLARAGRPLEDQVLGSLQLDQDAFQLLAGDETSIIEKVVHCVGRRGGRFGGQFGRGSVVLIDIDGGILVGGIAGFPGADGELRDGVHR